jgi:ATP-dependent RNA helicase RhlE
VLTRKKKAGVLGTDIIVATPGRLYDLALTKVLQLKGIKKLVIDEAEVMLDLGFRYQLTNILEFLPECRQNIMFSGILWKFCNTNACACLLVIICLQIE